MMEKLKAARWYDLVVGILLFGAGLMYFANPLLADITLVVFMASFFLVAGVARIVAYAKVQEIRSGFFLAGGIMDLVVGGLMIFFPTNAVVTLGILVSFWTLFSSIMSISLSFDLKRIGYSLWWLDLISGILGVFIALMLISGGGLFSAMYLAYMIAFYLCLYGILRVVFFFVASFGQPANKA